jgi:DNA polymerase III delta subunit
MIILVYGTDSDKVRATAGKHLNTLRTKRPDAEFFSMSNETFDRAGLEELIFSQGLFDKKFIVQLESVLELNEEGREFVLKNLNELAKSENAFVISERKLLKPIVSKLEKVAFKVENFEMIDEGKEKQKFNIFSLGDALGTKDKKQLWVLYTKALRAGIVAEQIHGILFAQVKAIAMVKRAKKEGVDAKKTGLNPFVVSKALEFEKNFTEEEVEKLSRELVRIYHGIRDVGGDMETELEKFVLGL